MHLSSASQQSFLIWLGEELDQSSATRSSWSSMRLFHPYAVAPCGLGKYMLNMQIKCILFVLVVFLVVVVNWKISVILEY